MTRKKLFIILPAIVFLILYFMYFIDEHQCEVNSIESDIFPDNHYPGEGFLVCHEYFGVYELSGDIVSWIYDSVNNEIQD